MVECHVLSARAVCGTREPDGSTADAVRRGRLPGIQRGVSLLKSTFFSSSRRLKPQIYFCTKMMMTTTKMRMNPVLGEDET